VNFDERMMQRLTNAEREIERLKVKESPGAWLDWTPTLTSGSGTFTDAGVTGYYFQIGKLVFVKMIVSIATNGTAAASVIVTLPITQKNTFRESFCGSAIVSSSGAQRGTLQVQSYPAGKVRIYKYDGTYPGDDGVALIVSGFYEVA
jgi:hypothetical protein